MTVDTEMKDILGNFVKMIQINRKTLQIIIVQLIILVFSAQQLPLKTRTLLFLLTYL
jgi:hypothetical protein